MHQVWSYSLRGSRLLRHQPARLLGFVCFKPLTLDGMGSTFPPAGLCPLSAAHVRRNGLHFPAWMSPGSALTSPVSVLISIVFFFLRPLFKTCVFTPFVSGRAGPSVLCKGSSGLAVCCAAASRAVQPGSGRLVFRGGGTRALIIAAHGLHYRGVWDLPRSGTEPVSSVLAGRLLSTVPPGKSQ